MNVKPIRKIVVALGGIPVNPRVVHEAVRLSHLLGAELSVVHMRYPAAGEPTMMMDSLPAFSEEDFRDRFRKEGYESIVDSISVEIVKGTSIPKLLSQITEGADLLIMGHKQRNKLLAALTLRSVPLQVLDVVTCPVVVIPKTD